MKTKYTWCSDTPGTEPKLYTTCLSSALYTSTRWLSELFARQGLRHKEKRHD